VVHPAVELLDGDVSARFAKQIELRTYQRGHALPIFGRRLYNAVMEDIKDYVKNLLHHAYLRRLMRRKVGLTHSWVVRQVI